ncbi:MAG: adenylate/guanylate cyclase domain-containing protein [Pirellulaceae bacterium]|nr:adenylate/guanylate cyclase domain-containing protein [Pirellulaceae bacterium]
MPDLIAQGVHQEHRWRRSLPLGEKVVLGRSGGSWVVPWDDQVSRQHAELFWTGTHLEVVQLSTASNPLFHQGRAVQKICMTSNDHFVIGSTTFTINDEAIEISQDVPRPVSEQTFSPEYLRQLAFRNADQRIQVLSRLPEIIRGASSERELLTRLVNVLLLGVARANVAAVVSISQDLSATNDEDSAPSAMVLHWDCRQATGSTFHPSERLIRHAAEHRESVVHVWNRPDNQETSKANYTLQDNVDWAFAAPIPGDACRGWVIYLAGSFTVPSEAGSRVSDPHDLRDEVKFTELVGATLGNLLDLRRLAGLSQFLSPVVLDALAEKDPDVVLSPREAEVSVLFCDLRGFSRQTEEASGDLLGMLERVSQAMGVMTRHILDRGGVVGDFHGDAAMGFWGWPFSQPDAIERACQTALAIRAEFSAAAGRTDHPLANFEIGLGLATGRAVAGKIGSVDQVKVTVFGPVVNLASRLENMTKQLRAGILLDADTAAYVRQHMLQETARVRRLAVVQPYGMQHSVEVSELLPSLSEYPQLTDEHIASYEQAVDALLEGDWKVAFEQLHNVPAEDRAKDFLTVFMAQHNRTPPQGWNGVIPLASK